MSITRRFQEFRELLGVDASADASTLKRAYRKCVLSHPPDRDPAAFEKIREAYERLSNPLAARPEFLYMRTPHEAPPEVPVPKAPDLTLFHRALVDELVQTLDPELLLDE